MAKPLSKPVKLLRAAKRVLQKYGWIQRMSGHPSIGFCARGALRHAGFISGAHVSTKRAASRRLTAACGSDIESFNDNFATSADEVLKKFDEAIARG